MPKRKKVSTQKQDKAQIVEMLTQKAEKGSSIKSIRNNLGVFDESEFIFIDLIIEELIEEGKVFENKGRFFASELVQKPENTLYEGTVDFVNPNFAFIRYDEGNADIFVSIDDLNGALHGDTVKASINGKRKNGKNPEGEVIEIISRGRNTVVGKIKVFPNYGLITPDNKGYHAEVFVPKVGLNGAQSQDLVIAKILEYPKAGIQAVAEVTEVLGKAGNNTAEMHAIMAEFDLPVAFPKDVVEEAEKILEKISEEEISKRKDFRKTLTFTIDPHDAKDFDDALSYKILDNGNVEVGIHIADVAHYIEPGSRLEEEAQLRATSVYLVDRTIPMLPEKLSNGLCSLRPQEEKLVFSAVFELNQNVEIINEWFGRSIIYSDKRFSYEEAQEVLEAEPDADPVYSPCLLNLNRMAHILRDQRFKKGAFNFETNEVKFLLDEEGKPTGIYQKVRKDAHKLIEEFMLLANKRVALYVGTLHEKKKNKPEPYTMVYRVHEPPNPTKVATFASFAGKLGFPIKTESNSQLAASLNQLMTRIEGTPMQNVLEGLAVRTMSKARYTTKNLGHFGLAFDYYSHFTSPIRRYPDVMAHRMLAHYLAGGDSLPEDLQESLCKRSSDREKLAAEAERASIKYKQVEYMSYQSRTEIYNGVVTGVTDFGVFVEINDTACEGMVRLADLNDDFYEYDAENFRVIGRRSKKIIGFGDAVTVKILATDLEKRSMDLQLISVGKALFKSVHKEVFNKNRSGRSGGRNNNNKPERQGKRRR